METKKASKTTWKHVICCLILLVIFMLTVGMHINAEGNADGVIADSSDTVPLRASSLRRLALSFLSLWGKDCGSIRRILQIIKAPPPSLRKHLQAWRSSQDGLQWK